MARATMKYEIRVTCRGETTTYKTRREAIKFYKECIYGSERAEQTSTTVLGPLSFLCMYGSEDAEKLRYLNILSQYGPKGAELSRYVNILIQLEGGETDCSDENY